MRPVGDDYAAAARSRHAVALALTLADTTIDDPADLIDESRLFWEVAAAWASREHGRKVQPPASESAVQAVINALRSIHADRERNEDPFAHYGLRPVQ